MLKGADLVDKPATLKAIKDGNTDDKVEESPEIKREVEHMVGLEPIMQSVQVKQDQEKTQKVQETQKMQEAS